MAEKIEDLIIKLELSVNDVNTVLASLNKPIEPILNVINTIKEQGDRQVAEFQEEQAKQSAND